MIDRGLYIVLEGGQGVGKSTQADMLASALKISGRSVKIMREPDSQTDAAARQIRRITQDPNYDLSKRTEVLLYNASRSQTLKWIKKFTDNGITCIVDRNFISTYINQYYLDKKDRLDYSKIDMINMFSTEDISPDVTLILDTPVEHMLSRKSKVNRGDKFDNLTKERLENARRGYLNEAQKRKIPVIDASTTMQKVHEEIIDHVRYAFTASTINPLANSEPISKDDTAKNEDPINLLKSSSLSIEAVSNLLVMKLAQNLKDGNLVTTTNSYDEKTKDGNYKYITPVEIKNGFKEIYQNTLDSIFERYCHMLVKLEKHIKADSALPRKDQELDFENDYRSRAGEALAEVLPVASICTISLNTSPDSNFDFIPRLQSDLTQEARSVASNLLTYYKTVTPANSVQTLDEIKLQENSLYLFEVAEIMKKHANNLPLDSSLSEDVTLSDYYPKNELDMASNMLYEFSDLPIVFITDELLDKDYTSKADIFQDYVGERLSKSVIPGSALESIHYNFDIVSDFDTFRSLQGDSLLKDQAWQELTPKHGYNIPKIVEDAGLADEYESCFDDSMTLYSKIFEQYGSVVAQYTTLAGHRLRWKTSFSAQSAYQFIENNTSPDCKPKLRNLVLKMHSKISEVHPLTASLMKFAGKYSDPDLASTVAKKYGQSKLTILHNKDK